MPYMKRRMNYVLLPAPVISRYIISQFIKLPKVQRLKKAKRDREARGIKATRQRGNAARFSGPAFAFGFWLSALGCICLQLAACSLPLTAYSFHLSPPTAVAL